MSKLVFGDLTARDDAERAAMARKTYDLLAGYLSNSSSELDEDLDPAEVEVLVWLTELIAKGT